MKRTIGIFLLFVSSLAFAQTETELRSPDAAMYEQMGTSVGISGSWMVAGRPRAVLPIGTATGSVEIFRWNGSIWVHHQKIFVTDMTGGGSFGQSVGIAQDNLIVGTPNDATLGVNSGSAYVFKRNDNGTPMNLNDDIWVEKQKLTALDGGAYDSFGAALGVSGNAIVVGAYRNGNPHDPMFADTGKGAAYIFRLNNNGTSWIEEKKLLANDGAAGNRFGYSVAISGNTVLIGAYLTQDAVLGTGAAYVFERINSNWVQKQKLQPSGPVPYTQFGTSVALEGDLAVIGDPFDDDRGVNFGSASLFRYNGLTWAKETEVYGSDTLTNERFGWSVGVSGGRVVVGAYMQTPFWSEAGAAYVFRSINNGTTWIQEQKVIAPDVTSRDHFGWSVAISGDVITVGVPDHGHNIYQAGAAYVFDLAASNCPSDLDVIGEVNAGDLAILLSNWGNPGCNGQIPCVADIDGNSAVNATDLSTLLNDWGMSCP